jgi:plastocyanin
MKSSQRTSTRAGLLAWATALTGTAHAVPQQIQVMSLDGKPVPLAVVSVMVKGTTVNGAGVVVDMGQREKRFAPTVVAIPVGGSVNFPNFDTVRHHVYSFSNTRKFEIKLYTGTPTSPVVFDKAGTATLGCNIHDTMLGYVHVVDTPYYGVTDTNGKVSIDLPAGEHKARIWTPAMGESVLPTQTMLKTGDRVTFKVKG